MQAAYAKSGIPATVDWAGWATKFSTGPYVSATHGGRYVQNYSNSTAAAAYGTFEQVKQMPKGSLLIKDSFTAGPDGSLSAGPLFMMEKMGAGFNADTGDWRYYMLTPDGALFGVTGGKNSAGMEFCAACHALGADNDFLLFLPEEYRQASN
jgi:hypothetical protein